MNDEEIKHYNIRFRELFSKLQHTYPRWNIEIPQIGVVSLNEVQLIESVIIKMK